MSVAMTLSRLALFCELLSELEVIQTFLLLIFIQLETTSHIALTEIPIVIVTWNVFSR